MSAECSACGLPDPYNGDGDGLGSCECPRCQYCGADPDGCDCGSGEEYYDDGMEFDDELRRVETIAVAGGLL